MKKLLLILVLLVIAAGAVWVAAGRAEGPAIDIVQPAGVVGAAGTLDVAVDAPSGQLSDLDVTLVQGERELPLFSLAAPGTASLQQETAERVRLTRGIGKGDLPELSEGPARIVVRAERPVLFGLRTASSEVTREFTVDLEPPRVAVLSTHHYVNHGGSEFVIYRVTPPEADSGVRVGEETYPGYPASGVHLGGVSITDPEIKVAFFALLYDQDQETPISVFASDEAGNAVSVPLEHRAFARPFKRSRIELTDSFLARVVPPIVELAPDLRAPDGELLASYLRVNGELRRRNNEQIASFAGETASETLWNGAFEQLANTQVEASFADHRTYFYKGQEVDQQVHLGFDLASTAHAPVHAGNAGTVVFADMLGIYGNTAVVDHGMGVQSLYGHLSSLAVKAGDHVEKGQDLGRSGQTGLAGGDHLHFTMLVAGRMVSPMEWWDPHWVDDRILRKLREVAGS